MKYFKLLILISLFSSPIILHAGVAVQSELVIMDTDTPDEEVYAYYDLRNRSSYVQVTYQDSDEALLCIHVQIFQQDRGCTELDFNDTLTPNDTVVYDMDNIIKNNGDAAPINLADNSYGFVAISAIQCDSNTNAEDSLIGNFRIVDDSGYEYRMNLIGGIESPDKFITLFDGSLPVENPARANVIIPFNTVDGATYAFIVGFVVEEDRLLNGNLGTANDLVYNEESGVTFSVFLVDENEERLSCDQKTIGCGPNIIMNYGINEDYPASRGENLLCEGAGLLPGQTHGYISLENATFLSPIDQGESDEFEFACLVGLNNGNGTGSMDECRFECIDPGNDCLLE